MTEDRISYHLQRLESLRTNRSTWDNHWEETAERLIPAHKQTFYAQGLSGVFNKGQKNTEKMYDATAALALHRFAAVIESITTPKNQMWHRLVPSEPELRKNRQVRSYLDKLNELLFRHRYRPTANFIGQAQKTYVGYGAYGNGMMHIDATDNLDGLRYKNLHLAQVYIDENHQGVVDTVYRSFRWKPRQIIQRFEDKNVPDSVKEKAKNSQQQDEELEVIHCIYPREDYDPQRKDAEGMPFASLYILRDERALLEESGYRTFPAPLARYMQFVNETYGRGPAQFVLPAMKVLNVEKKTILKQGHRIVDPVLLAYDDGQVGTFSLRAGAMNPGGVNAQGRPLVHPLPTGNLAVGQELMNDERAVINDAFLITLFQILVESHTMSATEVLERAKEKGMILAPTAGRLEAEFLGPMIDRELDVLDALGKLPPPPPVMVEAGAEYHVEYDNPLSRMVRAENAAGFMRSLDTAIAIFNATGDPSPLDWFDFDTAMPAIQDINGAPTDWTSSPEQVAAAREAREKERQEDRQVEAAPAMAGVMKAMSNTGE